MEKSFIVSGRYQPVCWLLLALFLTFVATGNCHSATPAGELQKGVHEKEETTKNSGDNTLQFTGLVDVGERLIIALLPGETVEAVYCKQGEVVKAGDPIVKLNNDAISNSLSELLLKKERVREGEQQLQLATLEKGQREKQLQKVVGLINNEKSLKNQVAGYASPIMQQLETQQATLQEQLELAEARITSLKENNKNNEKILHIVDEQLADLENRRQNLMVRAPFSGRIYNVNTNVKRVPPGGLVCELRNESFALVRARIIQHQRNLLQEGDMVKVALDGSPGEFVEGVVQSLEYMLENREGQGYPTFEVVVKIASPAKWVQPGTMVSVTKQLVAKGSK